MLENVRAWLSWLLALGVIVGLGGRVVALDHWHPQEREVHCCDHGQPSDDDRHTPDCPPWPHDHHTHACCHPAPLAGMDVPQRLMAPPAYTWLCVSRHAALPPDEPVFALDKPPLI